MSNLIFPNAVRGLTWPVSKQAEFSTVIQAAANLSTTRVAQAQNPLWHFDLTYEYLKDDPLDLLTSLNGYTDYRFLQGFYTGRYGPADNFLFFDPSDNSVGPGIITAVWAARTLYQYNAIIIDSNNHAQMALNKLGYSGSTAPTWSTTGGTTVDGQQLWIDLGVKPGTGWPNQQAQLQVVNDGAGNYYTPIQRNFGGQFFEDITDLVAGITVYENGSASGTGYTIGFGGLSLPSFSSSGLYLAWGAQPVEPVTASFQFFFRTRFDMDQYGFDQFMKYLWTGGGSFGKKSDVLKLVSDPPPQLSLFVGGNVPFPPITPICGTNMLILHPSTIALSNGTGPGTSTGFATGQAGPNAWYQVQINSQSLGSSGGAASFGGYKDPGIARGRICAVYSYIPYEHLWPGNGLSFCDASIAANSVSLVGGPNSTKKGVFLTGPGPGSVLVNILQLGVTAANLDFTTITQGVFNGASLGGFYGDAQIGTPMVLVFYT